MQVASITLDETVQKSKDVHTETYPRGRPNEGNAAWEEDGIPWIDVSFDGTWQKRGFSSHYGVGAVIDVLTGYVIDYDVMSTYCHVCAMNEEKLLEMTDVEQAGWRRGHEPNCRKNHVGSSKATERDAALVLWRR